MKSYQFFKIYKRFYKKREKTVIQQSMRKEKLRKVGLCFITGCFIKPLKIIVTISSSTGLFVQKIFFYFASSFAAQFSLFDVRMMQEISKGEIVNGK